MNELSSWNADVYLDLGPSRNDVVIALDCVTRNGVAGCIFPLCQPHPWALPFLHQMATWSQFSGHQ